MNYKILIYEVDKLNKLFMSNTLTENIQCDILDGIDEKTTLALAKNELPNLILFGFSNFNTEALRFIDSIKTDIATTDIPVVLMSEVDINRIKDSTYFYDIKYFIKKPFLKQDFLDFVNRVLEEENSFIGSYTNRFIKAFVSYKSSQNIASRMMSILETISYKIHIPAQIKLDMKSVLGILSTSVRDGSINKAIKFYEDMKFAIPVLKLLKGVKNPKNNYEQIIYAIYEMESIIYHNLDVNSLSLENVIEPEILKAINEVYNENEIFVKSGADFELVWDRLTDIAMRDSSLEFDLVNNFMEYSKNILREIILNGSDSFVKVINNDEKLEFIISPNSSLNEEMLNSQVGNPKIIKKIEKIEGKESLLITINKIVKKTKNKKIETENKISAKEYVSHLQANISNELADMKELEDELDINIISIESKKNLNQTFANVSSILSKYASKVLGITYEFDELEQALIRLSKIFINAENLSQINVIKLGNAMEQFKQNLKIWRNSIFIKQNTENIHYLDDGLINECEKIKEILQSH